MIRLAPLAILLTAAPVWAADPPERAVVNAVADVYRPLPAEQQKFGGIIGARLRANSEGYIERLAGSAANASADQIGTLLDAAIYTFEYNRDPNVHAVMLQLAKKLIASQPAAESTSDWTGQEAWTEGANLGALLHYYAATSDQSALAAATNLGNLFVKARHSNKDVDSLAAAIEPMVQLYRYTDDSRHLEFCTAAAEAWLHRMKSPEVPLTYKNLVVLNGLLELYRVNGDSSTYKVPLQAWTEMQASGFSLTGVPAGAPPASSLDVLDACTTGAWLQLTLNLFRISGQAVYSEQLEHIVYNQLFAAQDARTGTVLAPVRWSGKKEPANTSACAANEVRALALLPSIVWGRYGNGLAVNLYTDARTTLKLRRRGTVQLYAETTYPESGTILLHIEPDHPVHIPLRLRVPDWATSFTADIGPDHLVAKPGDYLTLNRSWKRGDTVKISMPMNARAIPGIGALSDEIAIARGPQVLALGQAHNPQITNFDEVAIDPLDSAGARLVPVATNYAANWMSEQAYTINGTYQGKRQKFILAPFADALNYRVWLAQSKASSGASGR